MLFAVIQLRIYLRAPEVVPLVEALVSACVAIGLVLYYRTLSRWGK